MPDSLFIPTEIPWRNLKGRDLEELLYWLFDAMGAKELEWRIGGTGSGASDGGRDLEMSFYVSSPDGELTKQRWWVEAKGRDTTVEPTAVKDTALNAVGKTGIDVIVIATNSVFSNPTRDWVSQWQEQHPVPKIKLWEKTQLEALCSKNPIVVVRLFGKALTPQGKLEVTKTKLWDYASFVDEPTLSELWKARKGLIIDKRALVALSSSEMANGDITARSWGMFVDENTLIESLGDGLLNFLFLVFRANDSGVRQGPVIRALSYLVLVCINRIGAENTAALLLSVWDSIEGREYPQQVRKLILQPVVRSLYNEVRDVCTSDCRRVSAEPVVLTEDEIERYWRRLEIRDWEPVKDTAILTIESHENPCNVGFPLGKGNPCPLCHIESPEDDVPEALRIIEAVTEFRGATGGAV